MPTSQTRCDFLATLSLVGAAGFLGTTRALATEPPLETTTIRLTKTVGICIAPQYVAEALLRAEGFTDIRYVASETVDRPWSQYFCCMLAGNREFVQNKPVATKRVVRAILKAADLCATQPARVARQIVDGGFTERYDYAFETLNELPYDKWREYDAEDTIRFYALRLHEVGMVKSSPQKIIADGTDWRFFNEVKRELKA